MYPTPVFPEIMEAGSFTVIEVCDSIPSPSPVRSKDQRLSSHIPGEYIPICEGHISCIHGSDCRAKSAGQQDGMRFKAQAPRPKTSSPLLGNAVHADVASEENASIISLTERSDKAFSYMHPDASQVRVEIGVANGSFVFTLVVPYAHGVSFGWVRRVNLSFGCARRFDDNCSSYKSSF